MSIRLGIIGGGVMAEAIISRLLNKKLYQSHEVLVSEPNQQRREFLEQTYRVHIAEDNQTVVESGEVLLLSIKPQVLDEVLSSLNLVERPQPYPLVISILAGVPLIRLEAGFPKYPILRVMPNVPATVGAGMTVISPGQGVKPNHLTLATTLFEAVGQVVQVPESLIDAVTGLSGSGPAFVAMMIEALADGGVYAGLPRKIAIQLALQTVLGTVQLLQNTELHPAQLKDKVTSPGGTTIAGVAQLEKAGFRSAIIEAVQVAYQQSRKLGE
ncbi:MAG: pyrroline-5-carboxylate reductase [cyanobacterium endosymbiont of Rhopalodia musculus]|uniref:pyrroline-5-carboxylate reductase n=1 Tax=cyanobacterium endosymbiont of Epithemia clementina EcSB TaxID=3034674 RepID=UPI0024804DF6|nr:pyrroline-5-carboxylate reductase [cyanobacterium endosymbiont of Epithemia clementina EcSB]WGT66675.1 pyrroline-5-carboxylate reductase [cyanobacterium endosymbiont of Epithemia clementina EcSB]